MDSDRYKMKLIIASKVRYAAILADGITTRCYTTEGYYRQTEFLYAFVVTLNLSQHMRDPAPVKLDIIKSRHQQTVDVVCRIKTIILHAKVYQFNADCYYKFNLSD